MSPPAVLTKDVSRHLCETYAFIQGHSHCLVERLNTAATSGNLQGFPRHTLPPQSPYSHGHYRATSPLHLFITALSYRIGK